MTPPVQRRNVGTLLQNHDDRILALEREPSAAGEYYGWGFEMARELLRPADFVNTDAGASTITFGSYGGTSALMTVCNALNEEMFFAMRLGPRGAMYHLQYIAQTGPDCGRFEFGWAQVPGSLMDGDGWPNDPVSGNPDSQGGDGLLYSPEDWEGVGLNWITIPDGAAHDLYSAGVVNNVVGGGASGAKYQQFRILGQPGDVMTTMSASGSTLTFGNSDGGPGIYMLRLKVVGANVNSLGYNIRLSSLTVQREFYDNFSV